MRHFFDVIGLEAKVKLVLTGLPDLAIHGFTVVGEGIVPIIDIDKQRAIERGSLLSLDSLRAIVIARGWILRYLLKDLKINRARTSYGLKHLAERQTGYLTNGQFIVAMLLEGYQMESSGADSLFNVREGSIRRLENA